MLDVHIVADLAEWRTVGDMLERLDRGQLLEELERAVTDAAKPLPHKASALALTRLPRRKGLAALVSTTDMPIVLRSVGKKASVLIPARPNAVKDPAAINRGRVRHPVFGHAPKHPVIQMVKPGWFTDPMLESEGEIATAIRKAVRDVLDHALLGG